MKKILLLALTLISWASLSSAQDHATIETFRKVFPNVRVEKIERTDISGLYAVEAGNNVFYFDPRKGYLLFGDIVTREGKNITAEKRQELLSRHVKEIPLEKGVRIGNGKKIVIEFTDPDCPFCRKTAEWFRKSHKNVTRYVFFYPIVRLHPGSEAKARYILGAKDKEKAYHEVMSGALDRTDPGKLITTKEASVLLKEHRRLAAKVGVFATPTLWVDGKYVPGANTTLIEKYLKGEK